MSSTDSDNPKTSEEVFAAELLEIKKRREVFSQNCELDEVPLPQDLVGLALSGGGIRSATFCLGFLQGLHEQGLLPIFDYLSTVSGGGFVGAWWTAWLSRTRKETNLFPEAERIEPERTSQYYGSAQVGAESKTKRVAEGSINAGKDPIHHLRLFANYLTPRRGVLSLDTWRAVTFIARNLVLTWLVLIPILIAAVLLGQLYFAALSAGDFPHEKPNPAANLRAAATVPDVIEGLDDKQKLKHSFFHEPSRSDIVLSRARIAGYPIGALAAISLFFAFCWLIGIQSGPRLLRAINAVIGLVVLGLLYFVFDGEEHLFEGILIFILGFFTVVYVTFGIRRKVSRAFRATVRLLKKIYSGERASPEEKARIKADLKQRLREETAWQKEVYLNAVTRWMAYLVVILICVTAVLAVAGFGHELVEYICCSPAPNGTLLSRMLQYALKSVSVSGAFAAVAGLIFTWFKAAPTGGGDKSHEIPSPTSQLLFAITPPLAVVVLAILTAWVAHGLVWYIVVNDWSDGLVMVTKAGIYLSFFFVLVEVVEANWGRMRFWLGYLIPGALLFLVVPVVVWFIPTYSSDKPLSIWVFRLVTVVGSLAIYNLLIAFIRNRSSARRATGGLTLSFYVLAVLYLAALLSGALWLAHQLNESFAAVPPDAATKLIAGTFTALSRCFLVYLCLIVLQILGRQNQRAYWLVTSLYLVSTTLLVMSYFDPQIYPSLAVTRAVVLLVTTTLAWVVTLGWMSDPNDLSIHSFYKGRLTRAYLGASNAKRAARQKEIIEAVEGDDVLLSEIENCRHGAPYHLINTTLNLVGGRDLATAQRSSAMFVLSKQYCGSLRTGYRETKDYMNGEMSLGTAVAISGAAVSPNMGSLKTTASLSMLLTLLNVRLGFWAPTPSQDRWRSAQARLWPFYTLRELLSETNDLSSYCYLTDGGHFDNTGLYSLVERGCRCIVIVDCGADPDPCFADLGTAIRRCRIDFQAEIDLDVAPLIRDKKGGNLPKQHYIVGQITYSELHGEKLGWKAPADEDRRGIVVYVKPALLADDFGLTADVRNFGLENSLFPQQTTADQWFDEAQFESYRRLGAHSAKMAFTEIGSAPPVEVKDAFARLKGSVLKAGDVLKIFRFLHGLKPALKAAEADPQD